MTPLSMATPGNRLRVLSVRAGWGLKRRLADLGLTPGVEIRVLDGYGRGPLMVEFRGSRIALGHGVALKIMVGDASWPEISNFSKATSFTSA